MDYCKNTACMQPPLNNNNECEYCFEVESIEDLQELAEDSYNHFINGNRDSDNTCYQLLTSDQDKYLEVQEICFDLEYSPKADFISDLIIELTQ